MRLLIGIMLLFLIFGIAESIQVGGTAEKVVLLGSLSKNSMSQINQTNATNQTNSTNQSSISDRNSNAIAITNPMSTIPVSNVGKRAFSPDSAQANSIVYRFTT